MSDSRFDIDDTSNEQTEVATGFDFQNYRISPLRTLGKKIGSGASASVFLAKMHDGDVAVKKIKFTQKFSQADCQNEVKILAKLSELKSPYIVKFIGYYHDSVSCTVVLEYMNRGTLEQWIKSESTTTFTSQIERRQGMQALACGVAAIHQGRYIICDIKSSNVLIHIASDSPTPQLKLADFGHARTTTEKKEMNAGTPSHMAPEVLTRKADNSQKSDIFSLCVVYWEFIHKQCAIAYYANKGMKTVPLVKQWLLKNNRLPIPTDRSICPDKLAAEMKKGFDKNPSARPDASDFVVCLKEIEADEALAAFKQQNKEEIVEATTPPKIKINA
jgi:serine/threonine protein kinase